MGFEFVAMEGFTGFRTATTEELPAAVAVMDPPHVARLAGDALDRCRRRVRHDTSGHRDRTHDPLVSSRQTLHTRADLLTAKQRLRLQALFGRAQHVEVEAAWGVYQHLITAYREPDRARGRKLIIDSVSHGVPAALKEVITLGRLSPEATRTSWPTSADPPPPTAPPKPSAGWSTSAAQPSGSATHQLHRVDHSCRPAASDSRYTLDHEERYGDYGEIADGIRRVTPR